MPKGESLFAKYPDYRVDLVPADERIQVRFAGVVVADSEDAVVVRETRHDDVVYFPRADVRFEHLERTQHHTFCPFKGEASYWSLRASDAHSENAVWGYEDPFDEVARLADYVAFYADRVDWSS